MCSWRDPQSTLPWSVRLDHKAWGEEEKEGGLTTEGQTVREYVMEKKMRVGSDAGEEDSATDSQIHPVY